MAHTNDMAPMSNKGVKRTRGIQVSNTDDNGPNIGIVECVELFDFMCHEHIRVALCPKVNFVTGENGSGKSAILTALIIALGGKASMTNRSSNLKGFIREGQPRALVKVYLRNRGPEAYQPEIYGDMILVERQLNRDTSPPSLFKIKNGTTGATISRKKEDLVAITDHMAIQIDNPINILSQDAAREFLASTSPGDMYHFFLKGTQLLQLSEDLEIVRTAITRAEQSINRKKEVLPEMKTEKRRWEQRYEDMRQARDLSAQMDSLSHQMAWAIVKEAEEEAAEADEGLKTQQNKLAKLDEKVNEEKECISEIDSTNQDIEQQMQQTLAQLVPLQTKREVPLDSSSEVKAVLRRFKQTETEMNIEARTTRERRNALKASIDEERKRLEVDNVSERENHKRAIAELNAKIDQEQARIEDSKREQTEQLDKMSGLRNRRRTIQEDIDGQREAIRKARAGLDELMRQTQNHMNAFGRGVPEALGLIDKSQWRRMRPIGPVGKYIKVRDPKWSRIIETTLDKSLNAFLVGSHEDRATLDSIFQKCGCQSRIIICSTELFDYTNGEPDSQFLTILRALDISNEIVKRQLINLNRIEQVILVEQRAMGDKIMVSNNGSFPKNVTACLTVDGYNVGSRSGGLATQAINLVRQSGRLGEDISVVINREKQLLHEQTSSLNQTQHMLNKTEEEMRRMAEEHKAASTLQRQYRSNIYEAESEIQNHRDALERDEPANIAALESEFQEAEEQIKSLESQFRDHIAQQKLQETELHRLEDEIAHIDVEIDAVRKSADQLRQKMDEQTTLRQRHLNNIEYWNAKRQTLEDKLQTYTDRHREAQEKVNRLSSQAMELSGERIAVERSAAKLDRMISEHRARLEEIERSSDMSLAEIAEKAQTNITAYNKAKEELRSTVKLIAALKSAHQKRLQKWTQFRDSMAVRTKLQFTQHLYQRGYTGKLEFDHANNKLVPKVQTDQDIVNEKATVRKSDRPGSSRHDSKALGGPNGHQRKDTKSLSGGEKSFTTICLLLSLWEAMSCPVRALDEFDVFMDAANRTIAMRMMVESARSSNNTQFILITPQDMSVKPDRDISIFTLRPPSRRV